MSIFKNSDQLKNLPTDDEELSVKERTVLDMLYPNGDKDKSNDNDEEDEEDDQESDDDTENKRVQKETKRKKLLNTSNVSNVSNASNASNASNTPNVPSKTLKNAPKDIEKAWFHFNDIIIATILFVVLSIPVSDRIIEKIVKIDNFYYRLAAKSVVFAILLFFINNFALSRKK